MQNLDKSSEAHLSCLQHMNLYLLFPVERYKIVLWRSNSFAVVDCFIKLNQDVTAMEKQALLNIAAAEGFCAAIISPDEVPVDSKFRVYCEQNLCGRYGANYSCPPDCGTPEALHQRLLEAETILVVETVREISGYEDRETVNGARDLHNRALRRLVKAFKATRYDCFCSGYGGCALCTPCKRAENQPCAYPDLRISCMSAYCVDVAELARRCGLSFAWDPKKLYLFGMVALSKAE